MPHAAPLAPPAPAEPVPILRGDLAIWLLVCAELLTFGIFFIAFAVARWRLPAEFAAGQAALSLGRGTLNTVLLLSGSAAVAQALHAARAGRPRQGGRWLLLALACALAFLGVKQHELAAKIAAGVDLDTNTFWMFYLVLTGFHFLHVLVATVVLALLWRPTVRGRYSQGNAHALETGAVFWHMVDLLWIVLFPLVYVLR